MSSALDLHQLVRVLFGSLFINACFFTAELLSYRRDLLGKHRESVEAYAHLMLGPTIFISFLSEPSFTGTIFFFLCLWNFFCTYAGSTQRVASAARCRRTS